MTCAIVVIELGQRVVLVDAGIGRADIDAPGRFGAVFNTLAAPAYDPAETAAARVVSLGYGVRDVTDVVMTHLDMDHAGGLADLPHARVHVSFDEFDVATRRADAQSRARYIERQMDAVSRWVVYTGETNAEWFGLPVTGQVDIDGIELLLISLPGHSPGHCGVAVRRSTGRWLLHAGDAIYDHRQLVGEGVPAGVRAFSWTVAHDRAAARASVEALQVLHREHGSDVEIMCAHDARGLAARPSAGA